MIEIYSKKGDFFVFDPETELISVNGTIVPYSEYQPVYVRSEAIDGNIPPVFVGILDKTNNSIITTTGNVNKLTNENDINI